ncbi:MAG: hypothetical protein MJZ03_03330 [archaeon]|nr:hypothetical protein [archaeon]
MKWLKSLFTDAQWDADVCKVVGFACLVCGLVGFFLGRDNFQFVILSGCALLGWKAKIEEV